MNKEAYDFGVALALYDTDLLKTAYSAGMNVVPAGVGAGLGLGLSSMIASKLPGAGKLLALPGWPAGVRVITVLASCTPSVFWLGLGPL